MVLQSSRTHPYCFGLAQELFKCQTTLLGAGPAWELRPAAKIKICKNDSPDWYFRMILSIESYWSEACLVKKQRTSKYTTT